MDRNNPLETIIILPKKSLSARRAWIEILAVSAVLQLIPVALRKESVDRNTSCTSIGRPKRVALRKESVDRNGISGADSVSYQVALRKESVDRNA